MSRSPRAWTYLLGAVVVALAPLGYDALVSSPVRITVVHVLAAAVVAGGVVAVVRDGVPPRVAGSDAQRALLWGGAVVLAAAVSTVTSADVERSVRSTVTLLLGLGVAGALVLVVDSPTRVRRLVAAACVGSLVVTVAAIGDATSLVVREGGAVVDNRPQPFFTSPNTLGGYAASVLMLGLGWLLTARSRRAIWAAGTSVAAAALALLASLSRGAWIGAACGLVVLAVMLPQVRRVIIAVLVIAGVFVGGSLLAGSDSGNPLVARASSFRNPSDNPDDLRPETWREGWRQFASRPVTGQGPQTFIVVSSDEASRIRRTPRFSAHNLGLNTAAELGVVGLVALAGFVVSIAIAVCRQARRFRADGDGSGLALLAGGAAALVSVLGQGLVDDPLVEPVPVIFTLSIVGLVLAQTVWPVVQTASHGSSIPPSAR